MAENEQAIYIELVHNTDDDSLMLLMLNDVKDPQVFELNLEEFDNVNWSLLKHRYGRSSESLLSNVETMFRSLEFFNLVKEVFTKNMKNPQFSPLKGQNTLMVPGKSSLGSPVTSGGFD